MPGRRLNDMERNLAAFWENPPAQFARPLLRQIRIENGTSIRGINSLLVPLPYPLTAICGRNGVGKSTILGLAALSAHSPQGWSPYWGNTRPRRTRDPEFDYSFSDFFHRGPNDPAFDGLRVGWVCFHQGNEKDIVRERRQGHWRHLPDVGRHDRVTVPDREIDFIPISRILPAGDQAAIRNAFAPDTVPTVAALPAGAIAKLSYILGKQYQAAETRYVGGLGMPACNSATPYSGFHMGSGEASVILILSRLEKMRLGGLMVIEEVELGLFAEAQARLVEVMLGYCRDKRIQIVCTTHSEVVLDNVPRSARVLLRKAGDHHEALTDVSTRFCVHDMSGHVQPEMILYTEDTFAASLVGEALAGAVRARVKVLDIGSNSTLARQAVSHLRSQQPTRALSLFDGDCTPADVQNWIVSERGERVDLAPDWLILPADGLSPEGWLIREIAAAPYLGRLASELSCTEPQAAAHIEAMRVGLDAHDCLHTLSQRTGLDRVDVRKILMRCVARDHPALDAFRGKVAQMLGGA